MARNAPTKLIITDNITQLVSDINDISFDLGATGRLNTNTDSDVVGAINELHDSLGDATLTTTATQVKEAINEIEAVFDASEYEISSAQDFAANVTGDFTVDASGGIILDADSGDVLFKDGGTQFASLTNTSGNLIIKSGDTTAMTFNGANVTTAGQVNLGNDTIARTGSLRIDVSANLTLDADGGNIYLNDGTANFASFAHLGSNNLRFSVNGTVFDVTDEKVNFAKPITADSAMSTIEQTFVGAINELDSDIGASPASTLTTTAKTLTGAVNELDSLQGNVSLGTLASTVTGAIAELHDSLGDATLTTTATQVKEAINEHETDIGNMTFTGLTATNISAAIRELRTELGNHSSLTTSTTTSAVAAVNELDAELGTITSGAMGTAASTVSGAIAELDSDRDDLITVVAPNVGMTTTATTVTGAINEHETDIGNMSLDTTASNLTAAINELHTTIGTDIDSDGVYANLANNNIGNSLIKLDNNLGNISNLDANINDRTSVVNAINSLQADIELLDSDSTAFDSKVGALGSLDAGFVGSERTSVVNALNALYASIPEIYDENGVQLN